MKALVVEQDFTSRVVMQKMLARYCETHIAVDGREAVEAIRAAYESNKPYGLVCLDTTMPELDGKALLEEIREFETQRNIDEEQGAKVILTTAEQDPGPQTCQDQGEAYLDRPVDRMKLLAQLHAFGIVR